MNCLLAPVVMLVLLAGSARPEDGVEPPWATGWIAADGVNTVYLGPDGRQWHSRRLRRETVKQFKALVEAAWAASSPAEIGSGRVLFFEPGGRVWFVAHDPQAKRNHLLAYDGRTWQEYDVGTEQPLGVPAHHAGAYREPQNASAAGRVFIIGSRHVWSCGDDGISAHRLLDEEIKLSGTEANILLSPEPDGRGMLAFSPRAAHSAWRWRGNTWLSVRQPAAEQVVDVVADGDGYWSRSMSGQLEFVPYEEVEPAEPVAAVVSRLNDPDAKVRDEATGILIARGAKVLAQLQRLLERDDLPPETRQRLRYVVALLGRPSNPQTQPVPVGPFTVDGAVDLFRFGDGSFVIAARSIASGEGATSPGLLRRAPDGEWTLRQGEQALRQWSHPTRRYAGYSIEVLAVDDYRAWVPGDHETVGGMLIDSALNPIARLPVPPQMHRLMATAPDGKVHVRVHRNYSNSVFAFEPVPGPSPIQPSHAAEVALGGFDVSPDGALYFVHEQQIWRVTQDQAAQVVHRLDGPVASLAAGRGGLLLLRLGAGETRWQLLDDDGVIGSSDEDPPAPDALIQQHLDRFLAAFAGSRKVATDGTMAPYPRPANDERSSRDGLVVWSEGDQTLILRSSEHNDDDPSTLTLRQGGRPDRTAVTPGFIETSLGVGKSPSVVRRLDEETFFISTPVVTYRLNFATGERSHLRFLDLAGGHLWLQYPMGQTKFVVVSRHPEQARLFVFEAGGL